VVESGDGQKSQLFRFKESPCLANPIDLLSEKYQAEPFALVGVFPVVTVKTLERGAAARRFRVSLPTAPAAYIT
jgi:hypothetical protein